MKPFNPLCVLLSVMGISAGLLSSCSSGDEGVAPPPPPLPPTLSENSFAYGDAESKIESVVYTTDENESAYTFYFSPTPGLSDLDAMLTADDFIEIAVADPAGEIDLLSENNRLLYKHINISSATADNVEKAELSLLLTGVSAVKMSLDAAMESGETLRAEYDGACIKHTGQQQGEVHEITLNERIFGYYMGPSGGGTDSYRVALTNAGWEGEGTKFDLTSEGYALAIDFYGTPGESWKNTPTGSFTGSERHEDHTFDSKSSIVRYRDADGTVQEFTLQSPVKIERDEAGVVTVTATFLDMNREENRLLYRGELDINHGALNVRLPQIERDVTIEGVYAQGVYNGDVMENGTGLTEITIYDQKAENNEPNGQAMKIAVFAEKFLNPKVERRLIPGTYKAATTYAQGTWMPTVEIEIMGMVIPVGTYAAYDDGTQEGQYSYGVSGDIVIRQGSPKTHYTIEFDLRSLAGFSIRGSYTGEVYLEDQSSDVTNDGTSSLTNDYQLDLDYATRADCYPQSEIWVRGLGTVPVSTACDYSGREYGYQYIQIGAETWEFTDEYPADRGKGKLVEGDILGIDLLVTKGAENKIATGAYPITTNRYPALFYPGVCVCGYNCYYGTSMMRIMSAIGYGYPDGYYDPEYKVENGWLNVSTIGEFASVYSGTVTVSKAAGGDNWYTFTIDGRDVLKHRITGSWTGPVYLAGSDTPVAQSGTAVQPSSKRRFPSFRELRSRTGKQNPFS